MIVFDLKCAQGHVFEAWFANSAAFLQQQERQLVSCPFCNSTDVAKALMAPNIGTKGNQAKSVAPIAAAAPDSAPEAKKMLAALAKAQAELLAKSEWVGRDFDAKARAMEAGEVDRATIHGEVTRDEATALIEDGIGVMPLPFPVVPPSKRN